MNAETVRRVMSLIPERVARVPTGVTLEHSVATTRYPERVAHLVQFLHWMSPLSPITRDDQRVLGLLNAQGRPVHAVDIEADEEALEGEAAAQDLADEAAVDEEAIDEDLEEAVAEDYASGDCVAEDEAEEEEAGTPVAGTGTSSQPLEISHA